MFFCPTCNNAFDITKTIQQKGGNILVDTSESSNSSIKISGGDKFEDIINKILEDKDVEIDELKNVSFDELIKNQSYKKLKSKQKEKIYNKFQDLLPKEQKKVFKDIDSKPSDQEKAYFICNNCGFIKKIEPKTLIFSRTSETISQSYDVNEYNDMLDSKILPRTRKYVCPNSNCESHDNPYKREAVFFRLNNSYKIKYICNACGTDFN
ncbi:DNA-directed RNA polymerase subunit RPB9 [uncultured virus]|nr:DNA-directed RNA polymerase subunit RPB9 [uncultured virus]